MLAVGLMSGTSLDGVDAALVAIEPLGAGYAVRTLRFVCVPFIPEFADRLLAALPPREPSPATVADLDAELGELFADAARAAAGGEAVDYAASHGLTLHHAGERARTVQIGDPYRVRDRLGATVVHDFRRADCAAGGAGAPLVPHVDAMLLARPDADVVALNLGGIANVTVLPRGAARATAAWDTGPANVVLDAFVRARTGGAERFDAGGAHAARGTASAGVVAALVALEAAWLAAPPPKSTGRERFGDAYLAAALPALAALSLEDGCATLCALTAETVGAAIAAHAPRGARVVASGGGARNPALVRALRDRLARDGATLALSDDEGVDADAKEAVAFAVLGYECLRERPANVPAATGAARPAVLGAIVPCGLGRVLTKMRGEVARTTVR